MASVSSGSMPSSLQQDSLDDRPGQLLEEQHEDGSGGPTSPLQRRIGEELPGPLLP
jgi:hypothetical protein